MSLHETTLISVLEGLSNNTFNIDPNLPINYVNMISEYSSLDKFDAFEKSLSKNKFQLADYFLSKIADDTKEIIIIDSMGPMAADNNIPAINYLIKKSKNYGINLNDMLDSGLYGAVKGENFDLISWFIEQGADDMNTGLIAAVERNNKELIQYFIDRGANHWQFALNAAVTVNNIELVDYFAQLLGANNIQYDTPLAIANLGYQLDIVNYLINLQVQTIQLNDVIYVGPVLKQLIDKLTFIHPYDFNSLFPLCKQGYVSETCLGFLLSEYVYENKLRVSYPLSIYVENKLADHNPNTTFIMDDFLKDILIRNPALYDIIPKSLPLFRQYNNENHIGPEDLIPNTSNKSSMEIIINDSFIYDDLLKLKFAVFDLLFIGIHVGNLNRYNYDDLPQEIQDTLNDPLVIEQAKKERIFFHIMNNVAIE